jgi:TonB family protein
MILKVTVLLLLASAANLALRRASASLRHYIWLLALVAVLLIPAASLIAPRVAGPQFVIRTTAQSANLLGTPSRLDWWIIAYLAGVAIVLLRLLLDMAGANRLANQARPNQARPGDVAGVRISGATTVPFAWGLQNPVVVVPAEFLEWPNERRQAVLAHELAHIARHDISYTILARVACAVYWFHPLAWWAAAQMRREADRACDDAVLRSGFDQSAYANDLVEIARSFQSVRLAPGAIRPSELERRVRHIIAPAASRRNVGRLAAGVAALLCLCVAIPLAAVSQEQDDGVYKVGGNVKAPRLLTKTEPLYTPDASARKVSGSVLLQVTVGTDGKAHNIVVKKSLDAGLDSSAVDAVGQWTFQPGTKEDKPVNVTATIEVNFRLK